MRLAGQQKCGYYPAPPEAVSAALMHLDTARRPFHVLDPCAGEGLALEQIANMTGGMPRGIELDEKRGAALKLRIADALAPASAFGVKVVGNFDLLWLNPPYDDEIGGGGRVETTWLTHWTTWLRPGGVLCLVVPEHVIERWGGCLGVLKERYEDVTVMPFPEEHRKFKEVVAFGYRRAKTHDPDYDERYAPFPYIEPGKVYMVPNGIGPRTFEKSELTDEEVGRALYASKLQALLAAPREVPLPRPPLPLAKGHIAMLLASGHLDGIVRPEGEEPHVVRGTAQKKQYLKEVIEDEKDDGSCVTKSIYAEKIVLTVRAVDRQGNLKTFKQE